MKASDSLLRTAPEANGIRSRAERPLLGVGHANAGEIAAGRKETMKPRGGAGLEKRATTTRLAPGHAADAAGARNVAVPSVRATLDAR